MSEGVKRNYSKRPPGVDVQAWKNRYQVYGKLTEHNHDLFFKWCRKNNLNFNSGLNRLISSHPELNPEFKNHA
tara:strand:+ start:50 stop:268 length:219 start_codon:yes stop_codon:yes gene_type:complete